MGNWSGLEILPARQFNSLELSAAHRSSQMGQREQLLQRHGLDHRQGLMHLAHQQADGDQEADGFFSWLSPAANSTSSASIIASAIFSACR